MTGNKKLRGGFASTALWGLSVLTLVFVFALTGCDKDDDSGGGNSIVSDYQGEWEGWSGTPSGTLKVGKDTIEVGDKTITGVKTSGGDDVVYSGTKLGTWTYVYKGSTKIGIAYILSYEGSTSKYIALGQTYATVIKAALDVLGVNADISDVQDDDITGLATKS
ncbi:MAG: hypothetical protein LBG74_06490 [Spirochaetaceae bacterium]|jgi:hypothetical protein|nr:hypothetical protein [Spirochaetaceae bacterium]